MTEKSWFPWETQTGTGDGEFSFDQDNSNDFFRYFDTQEPTTQGVAINGGGLNNLGITGSGAGDEFPLEMETGAAVCYGRYWNNLELSLTTPYPVISTGGRVILEAVWADNEIRAKVIMNTLGVTTPPAITQIVGTNWQIPIASFILHPTGFFTNFADERVYLKSVRRVDATNIDDRERIVSATIAGSRADPVAVGANVEYTPIPMGTAGVVKYYGVVLQSDSAVWVTTSATSYQINMPSDFVDDTFEIGFNMFNNFAGSGDMYLRMGLGYAECGDATLGQWDGGLEVKTLGGAADPAPCFSQTVPAGLVTKDDTITIQMVRANSNVLDTYDVDDTTYITSFFIRYTADS